MTKRNKRVLSIGVADEAGTRVGFDETNAFYWHLGDKVCVQTSTGFKQMTLRDEFA